jgi:hypothetical protein
MKVLILQDGGRVVASAVASYSASAPEGKGVGLVTHGGERMTVARELEAGQAEAIVRGIDIWLTAPEGASANENLLSVRRILRGIAAGAYLSADGDGDP